MSSGDSTSSSASVPQTQKSTEEGKRDSGEERKVEKILYTGLFLL